MIRLKPVLNLSGDTRSGHMELDYWNGIGTGIVGTIGYVVLPTGVSTDVSRDTV